MGKSKVGNWFKKAGDTLKHTATGAAHGLSHAGKAVAGEAKHALRTAERFPGQTVAKVAGTARSLGKSAEGAVTGVAAEAGDAIEGVAGSLSTPLMLLAAGAAAIFLLAPQARRTLASASTRGDE